MIEDAGRRVGCLLHPLARGNGGVDWRGLSDYGGMACRTDFCPSVRHLPVRWLTAVRQRMDQWYLHGRVVTERRLPAALFTELENRMGRLIDTADFSEPVRAAALLKTLTTLKLNWPNRRRGAPGVCNYFFEDGLYPHPAVNRRTKTIPASRFEELFQELDSGFSSVDHIKHAEATIEGLLVALELTRRSK
ncbi:MAG: hypothetical protein KFF68_07075 [Desulfosarcina sp.]|nr:hypothetical protein [Desulfosarcina sp.]